MNEHTNIKKILGKLKQNWALFFVGILFITGFLLRLFVVLRNEFQPVDALQYMENAKAIIGVEGSTYAYPREPFYSFLLSLVYLIFPNTFMTARIFTALIGSFNIVVIFYVTRKYAQKFIKNNDNEKFGIIASLLVCLNYKYITYDGNGVRTSLFTLLFLILMYAILIDRKKIKKITYSFCAFLLILTKSESLILLIGISLFIYYKENILRNKNMNNKMQNNNENKNSDNLESDNNNEFGNIRERMLKYFKTTDYSFTFIPLGLIIGSCLWILISSILFGDPFASSNWMSKLYYSHEFNEVAPDSLSTFSYLFDYHSFKEVIYAIYKGFFNFFRYYLNIYGRIMSAFFILTLIFYLFKKDYLSLFWIFYPLLILGMFSVLWSMGGVKRILVPYSTIAIISLPIFTFEILENFNIYISKKIDIKINKTILYYLIFVFICLENLQSALDPFWL